MKENYYREDVIEASFKLGLAFFKDSQEDPEIIFEKNKKIIMDLLKDKLAVKRCLIEEDDDEDDAQYDWSDKIAKRYAQDLTPHQRVVFKTILGNDNKANLEELQKALKKAGLSFVSNRTFAGIFSGLTRKCQTLDIPNSYSYEYDDKEDIYIYSISSKALPFISKFL